MNMIYENKLLPEVLYCMPAFCNLALLLT